jgi:hypothetical protein
MAGKEKLDFTKAPALPYAPVQYDRAYQDTSNNILRQYFNSIDNVTGQLLSNGGGRYLSFPHIAAQDTTNQYAVTNTATKVLWNTLDSGLDFTLNLDSTATATHTGIYKIDYSLQFANNDNALQYVYVWLQVGGVNVVGSGSKFAVPARKSVGSDGYLVAYSSVTFEMTAGQSMALYWATSQAYVVSPLTNGVYMEAYAAQTSPFAMPSIPSAIGSIVFVSGVTT